MDLHWMQSFLGLLHFDSPPSSSSPPLKSNRPVSLDEVEGEDDSQREFACPFCYEDFDIGSLCYHLEHEHHLESKSAACPVCAAKIGKDIVAHITLQHGHFFKMQRRRRFRMATTSSSSTIPLISKEFWEASLQAHLEGFTDRSALSTPHDGMDPLLSNFVYTLPVPDSGYASKPTATSDEACPVSSVSTDLHNTSDLVFTIRSGHHGIMPSFFLVKVFNGHCSTEVRSHTYRGDGCVFGLTVSLMKFKPTGLAKV